MLLQAPAHSLARSTDYRAVFDGLADPVLLLDPAGVLIGANPAALAAAGRWLEPSLSQALCESGWWRSPADRERFRAAVQLAAGGDPARCEAEVHGVGGRRHIEIALTPISTAEGRVNLVLAQARDIPLRHRAGMPLRESEKLLRQITETIHEVFWMTNPRGDEILYVSPGYETIWGRSVESVYRHPLSFLEAIHPADRSRVVAGLARQARGNHVEEFRVLHLDGTVRWVRSQAFATNRARSIA